MTTEEKAARIKKYRDVGNYLAVAVISLVSVLFLPMIANSYMEAEFVFPDTFIDVVGWITTKVCMAAVNLLIFNCFVQQAKINVENNEDYVAAKRMYFTKVKHKKLLPRSPEKFNRQQWIFQGTKIALFTFGSTFFLAQCIIAFDAVEVLTYLFTVTFSVTFSYINMRRNEDFWTSEFPEYVQMIKDQEDNENDHIWEQGTPELAGASSEECAGHI